MANFFAFIQFCLASINLWNGFLDWMSANYTKELTERQQQRESAVDGQKKAATEDDFDKAQDDIVNNHP